MIYAFLNNPKMNFNAFIHLFFILLKFSYSTSSEQCTKSTSLWHSLKYPYLNLLKNFKLQNTPLNCPISKTSNCCNSNTLKEMSSISEIKLKGFAEDKLEYLLMMFSNDSFILMNMYLNDLENTKNDLNQLFSATYGYNYKVEKNFFFSWFDKLKLYMEGKKHNIGQLLDDFFLEMAGKIVKILIPPESSPEVTKCQIDHLIEAKPYQEADNNLKKNIIRSYSPARLFVNAIAVGRDAFKALLRKTTPTPNCLVQFNNQFHCMLCNGLAVKSCPDQCKSVMDNCFGSFKLAELKKLDKILNKYLNALVELTIKLDNQLNFPAVNHKMNVQISTAIMNIQNIYPTIKEQIKTKCQNAGGMSRKKRQAAEEILNWQTKSNDRSPFWEQKLNNNLKSGGPKKNTLNSQGTKLTDFLTPISRTIKIKYKTLEGYFLRIVPDFCSLNSESMESPQCWNATSSGINVDKNNKKKVDKSSVSIFKTVTNQLKDITLKINDLLKDKNPDPDTVKVEEYLLYKSKQSNKLTESVQKTPPTSIEGSGDFEKFPISPVEQPKKPEPEIVNPILPSLPVTKENPEENNNIKMPEKPNKSQFSTWEGSGDSEEIKSDQNENGKPIKILVNTPERKPSTLSSRNISSLSPKTILISTESNLNIDDEDMVSKSKEVSSNIVSEKPVITSSPRQNIIPEGSGSDPDINPNKPPVSTVETVSTTVKPTLPEKPVEGSGSEVDPVPEERPPVLPVIPESKISAITPSSTDSKLNPDIDIEGSGRAPLNPPIPSKPQTITDSTLSPTKSSQPDQFPGTIPSEVWIPGVIEVKNSDKDNQKTTPGSSAISNHKITVTITITTLSLLLLYCLK